MLCSVLNHRLKQLINFRHLRTVPLNFILAVVAAVFEQGTRLEHVCILLNEGFWLHLAHIMHRLIKLSYFLFEDLVSVFLSPGHTLEFS